MFQDWGSCISTVGTNAAAGGAGYQIPTLTCVPIIFNNIVVAALIFSGVVALYFLLFAGYKYVTSGGDPKQVGAAQSTLTYAIIGLVLILLSFFIINLIGYITGVTCISSFGFDQCK